MIAARIMCPACTGVAGLNMAAIGSRSTILPPTKRNPAGSFIQALAQTTKMPTTTPATIHRHPGQQVARPG